MKTVPTPPIKHLHTSEPGQADAILRPLKYRAPRRGSLFLPEKLQRIGCTTRDVAYPAGVCGMPTRVLIMIGQIEVIRSRSRRG